MLSHGVLHIVVSLRQRGLSPFSKSKNVWISIVTIKGNMHLACATKYSFPYLTMSRLLCLKKKKKVFYCNNKVKFTVICNLVGHGLLDANSSYSRWTTLFSSMFPQGVYCLVQVCRKVYANEREIISLFLYTLVDHNIITKFCRFFCYLAKKNFSMSVSMNSNEEGCLVLFCDFRG